MSDLAAEARPAGLRERKKARTRASIRQHALRLFHDQGYTATTVEQIAAAAEISSATFFRYFPTKEDVVLQDDFDLITLSALLEQPADMNPVAAFRAAARQGREQLTDAEVERFAESALLTMTVPEIRVRALDEMTRTIEMISGALATRTGRPADDLAIRSLAGAMIGVIMAVTLPMAAEGHTGQADIMDMFDRIDAGLAQLEAGLPV